MQENNEPTVRYREGTKTIPDSTWLVETVDNNEFIEIGKVHVKGSEAIEAMRTHRSIKGYTPFDLAKKKASEKYSKFNPIIVTEVISDD